MNTYKSIASTGFIIWLLEASYFGWNMSAQSGAERVLDVISGVLITFGVIGLIAYDAAEKYHEDHVVDGEVKTEEWINNQ